MLSALYYPHTSVQHEGIIKTALLLWDKLEYVVPHESYRPEYRNGLIAEAMNIVGAPRVPTEAEKRRAHAHIEELTQRQLPTQFYFNRERPNAYKHHYEVWPQKLLPKTWDLLRESQWAGELLGNSDYPMTEPAGLTVMSVLADCCAGTTRTRITDRDAAYATLSNILGSDSRSRLADRKPVDEQLVAITLSIIDAPSMSLGKLVEFRKREVGQGGHAIRDLRHRYLGGLEAYVNKLKSEDATESDALEIKREFEQKMKDDLAHLREELGLAKRETLLSKEILVTTLAAFGTVAAWAYGHPIPLPGALTSGGAIATVGGALGAGNKYLTHRRTVLKNHPMAYLHELQKFAARRHPLRWAP